MHEPTPATPMTKEMALALIYRMIEIGQTAAVLTFAWGGYLRASEALRLLYEDVAYPGDHRLSAYGADATGVAI
ncbi:hypothetical protein FGB62_72g014 [Gracilaria domingensis]|nr:hypothetical protein FGB62_72g014 [Gracilaria domingensis]